MMHNWDPSGASNTNNIFWWKYLPLMLFAVVVVTSGDEYCLAKEYEWKLLRERPGAPVIRPAMHSEVSSTEPCHAPTLHYAIMICFLFLKLWDVTSEKEVWSNYERDQQQRPSRSFIGNKVHATNENECWSNYNRDQQQMPSRSFWSLDGRAPCPSRSGGVDTLTTIAIKHHS